MASVGIGEGLPATGLAGLRDLTSPAAFDWRLDASGHSRVAVAASVTSGAVEFHIPWGALGFTSRPPDWSAVVLAAVIVGPDGQAVSTQSLPVNTPGHVTDLYRLEITW